MLETELLIVIGDWIANEIFEKLAKILFEKETIMSDELEKIIGFPQFKESGLVLDEVNAVDRVKELSKN